MNRTDTNEKTSDGKGKRRPPGFLFALGHAPLPAEVTAEGVRWRYSKLFKHDFFAATGLYERVDGDLASAGRGSEGAGGKRELAVLKVQRTYPLVGFPMKWLGARVARREIRIFRALQGVTGVPRFLGEVGVTGFLHAFVPGVDLHGDLPLTGEFFARLEKLFSEMHERHIAYVDTNKRENILYGDDGLPWLIDFQISFQLKRGAGDNFIARWWFRRFVRADWYHFYKHKTRLLPGACSAEDFAEARKRGFLHQVHRVVARPIILLRRKFLSRYDLANTR